MKQLVINNPPIAQQPVDEMPYLPPKGWPIWTPSKSQQVKSKRRNAQKRKSKK